MHNYKKIPRETPRPIEQSKGWLPSIHFTDKQLPQIKNWEPGKIYEVALQIKQKSKELKDESKEISASFEIIGVKALMNEKETYSSIKKTSTSNLKSIAKERGLM